MAGCIGDCLELGPPPDMILSMPPPPLPSFLLPRSAIVAVSGNNSQPCFAAFVCEPSLSGSIREQTGIEFIELGPKGGSIDLEDTWIFVLVSSCVGVILLGALLALILIKCRDTSFSSHPDPMQKQPMPIIGGTILYPNCSSTMMGPSSADQLPPNADNRMVWAALTSRGTTRHFVADNSTYYPNSEDHYEVVDYYMHENKMNAQNNAFNRTPIKTFDNSGFVDFDYADPTPLMQDTDILTGDKLDDDDNIDLDSGYQEPQEVLHSGKYMVPSSPNHQALSSGSNTPDKKRHHHYYHSRTGPRPVVSSPTRIEDPNVLPPLNLYPQISTSTMGRPGMGNSGTHGRHSNRNKYITVNHQGAVSLTSLNRRISDLSIYNGSNHSHHSRQCANI